MNKELQETREDYQKGRLDKASVDPDPIVQFEKWFKQYKESALRDFNSMVLSTVGANNRPSSRVVLLKGFGNKGFEFFTNYQSHKAYDISVNNSVALLFYWPELERQVRISGKAHMLTTKESDLYFSARPRDSQIGAWASPQSQVLANRKMLEDRLEEFEKRFPEKIERPDNWGGYRVEPESIEFWQGRASRLHDRIIYVKNLKDQGWTIKRLAP